MEWHTTRKARWLPMALAGFLIAGQSHAAETPAQKRERALQQRLEKSDTQAALLQQRIEELEKRVNALRQAIAATPPPAAATRPVAQAAPPKPAAAASKSAAAKSAPGSFEVDEEAAQRALERTLTQSGALLLPVGTLELTPGFTYQRNERSTPVLVNVTTPLQTTPALVLANQRNRRNEFTAQLGIRAGMPYNSQLELALPYNYVRTSQINDLGTASSGNGNGFGDVTLGVAKTMMRESGWKPDLIGRLSYNFGNARRNDGDVTLLGGFRQWQGELVALKRQDPLAFVASVFYNKSFEKDAIEPGNAAGFSLSTVLAASPATSLTLGFSQLYRKEQKLNGADVAGSDQTYGIVSLGATSVLSRDTSLITQVGIGVGNDAPKYTFTVALPILFR